MTSHDDILYSRHEYTAVHKYGYSVYPRANLAAAIGIMNLFIKEGKVDARIVRSDLTPLSATEAECIDAYIGRKVKP